MKQQQLQQRPQVLFLLLKMLKVALPYFQNQKETLGTRSQQLGTTVSRYETATIRNIANRIRGIDITMNIARATLF